MRKGKGAILFYFKQFIIIITLVFVLNLTYSCDFGAKKYSALICNYSKLYCVEPALIFAIAETESHFNPQAKSSVGALGIMQIMPETGEWIASSIGYNDYQSTDLLDPEINIRFGVWYLSYLFSLFDERWQRIAAYNAGIGNVNKWIDCGVTSNSIPLEETAQYVAKVEKALSRYRRKKYAAFD